MQDFITDRYCKPPVVTAYESTADSSCGSEFLHLMSAKPCQSLRQSTQHHPTYEPGRYATLPTRSTREDLRLSSRETGKTESDWRSVETSDRHVSHSSEAQSKSALLPTGHDGKPVLLEEYQGESVWNPRASMAFDNAKGLLNPIGQNNCFLNSAVQVLWHLDVFRRNFRVLSGHGCVQNSCIFCALKVIFTQFQFSDHHVLPSDVLREALAEAFANERRFQLGRMDDASECFETILQRIHFHLAWNQSEETCQVPHCITHQKFAMLLVEQMVCGCNASDEPLIFNQLVYHVSTSAIISYLQLTRHRATNDLSFGRLLYCAKNSGETRRCLARCGELVETRHTLANTPEVVSIGFIWDSDRPSRSHIRQVIQCISTELRPSELVYSVVDEGWGQTTTLKLAGLVCYHGRHYSTFFFHSKMLTWILFDDARVREIGPSWHTLMDLCVAGLYQPLLLLYADPNDRPIDISAAPAKNISLQHELVGIMEEAEHDGVPEAIFNEKQSNASQCSSRRDLLFGGNCATERTGSSVCTHLSPGCWHKSQSGKILEAPVGWMHSPGTMSLTRDKSTMHLMDCAKRKNGDFLTSNQLSYDKVSSIHQESIPSQQATAAKKAAANFSTIADDRKRCFSLSQDQVGAAPCTSVAYGTHGSTILNNLEPTTNRVKTVQFSHQGVGVSPGGTIKSFVVSYIEQYPGFHEQSSKTNDPVRSADRVPNSLNEIEHRSRGDRASDGSQNNFPIVETLVESDHGPSQSATHSTDKGKSSGVYITERAVRDTLGSQGISRRRLAPKELAYSRSAQIGKETAEVTGGHEDPSGNRKSIATKVKTTPSTNCSRFAVSRAHLPRNLSSEERDAGNSCSDKAKFKDNKCTVRHQPLSCSGTSSTKPSKSKYAPKTSKLISDAEFSSADLCLISKTATEQHSLSAYRTGIPSVSTEMSGSGVPHCMAASCQTAASGIPSSNVDNSLRHYAFPQGSRNTKSQTSDAATLVPSLDSTTENHSKNSKTCAQTANELNSINDNNRCRWVEQRCAPLDNQVKDWQPFHDREDYENSSNTSHESKIHLYRDCLQMLNGCDEHVILSKAELDVGNERLAAEHCRIANALLEDAFQPCQLDDDLVYLFHCSQNNVQKCENNLKRYLTHFPNNDIANEEHARLVGSNRDMEPVFYLSAYITSRQVEPVDTKGRSVDDCKISSLNISSQALVDKDKEGISNCRLRPMIVKLTRDPAVNRDNIDDHQSKSNPQNNFSRVNNTNTVASSSSSNNGKFTSSSLPRSRTNLSSSSAVSAPRNSTSISSSVSLHRNDTSRSPYSMSLSGNSTSIPSSVSIPRNCTSVSRMSMSLPRNNTRVSSSVSIPRNSTSISSSELPPRNGTCVSSSKSIPRNSTSVSSMSLNGTSSQSFSAKGTSASSCTRRAALPVSVHNQPPKTQRSYQTGSTGNSERTCRIHTNTLTDCEPK